MGRGFESHGAHAVRPPMILLKVDAANYPLDAQRGASERLVKVGDTVRVLVLSKLGKSDTQIARHLPGGSMDCGDIVFQTDPSEPTDLVVVLNYIPYDLKVQMRRGWAWVWDNEPQVRTKHPRGFSKIFSHLDRAPDSRAVIAPPALDWWIKKSFDELVTMDPPSKARQVSAIASTKTWKPGHQRRQQFFEYLERSSLGIDIFGQGRPNTLDDKWDGIAPYKYSIAIENTSKADYWTEKISDCFLSYTVPVYFGATNISQYFPRESFIWLPLDNQSEAEAVMREVVAANDWEDRLPALQEARNLVLHRYSLYAQLSAAIDPVRDEILSSRIKLSVVPGRRTSPGGWKRGEGIKNNLRARMNRRAARVKLASGSD